jgi:hypothetical protein
MLLLVIVIKADWVFFHISLEIEEGQNDIRVYRKTRDEQAALGYVKDVRS